MSPTATTQRMTAEEFCEWVHRPENANRWFELVRGEVIELPPPMKIHGRVCVNVAFALESYVRMRGQGYVTSNDSGVILERDPDTVRGPDVAVYEDADTFDELHPKYGEVPPRLAVEVLSPTDRWGALSLKIADYLRAGVQLVWVLDPQSRDVTVYRPGKDPYLVRAGQDLTGEDVLPDFRCPVNHFFILPKQLQAESQPAATPPGPPQPPAP